MAWRGHLGMLAASVLLSGLMSACVSENPQEPIEKRIARAEKQLQRQNNNPATPQRIDDLLRQLMTFQADVGRMPTSLAELAEHLKINDQEREQMFAFAYSPRGLGVLDDGRLILVVDSQITPPAQAWCIIQNALVYRGPVFVEANLITMEALQQAAKQAR